MMDVLCLPQKVLRNWVQLSPVKCPSYSKATLIQNMSPNLETILQANKCQSDKIYCDI